MSIATSNGTASTAKRAARKPSRKTGKNVAAAPAKPKRVRRAKAALPVADPSRTEQALVPAAEVVETPAFGPETQVFQMTEPAGDDFECATDCVDAEAICQAIADVAGYLRLDREAGAVPAAELEVGSIAEANESEARFESEVAVEEAALAIEPPAPLHAVTLELPETKVAPQAIAMEGLAFEEAQPVGRLAVLTARVRMYWAEMAPVLRKITSAGWRTVREGGRKRRLRLAESLSLGEKRFVAIVQVGEQSFLIGGSQQSVSLLAQLPAEPRNEFKKFLERAEWGVA